MSRLTDIAVFNRIVIVAIMAIALSLSISPATAQLSNLSLTLYPVPCRSVDTRIGEGVIQDNEIYVFSVDPLFSSLQGGVSNCGVPSNAAAVKLLVKGQSQTFDGGYFRVFNASVSVLSTYSHLQLQDPLQFVGAEFDIPINANLQVAIHTLKQAHAVVDIAGYYLPIELTGMVAGEVVDKQTAAGMPPAVELTLDNGAKVVCSLPDSDHLNCDTADIGQSIVASGRVVNLAGAQSIYAIGEIHINQ